MTTAAQKPVSFDKDFEEKTSIGDDDTFLIADCKRSGSAKKIKAKNLLGNLNQGIGNVANKLDTLNPTMSDLGMKIFKLNERVNPLELKYAFQVFITYINTKPFINKKFISIQQSNQQQDIVLATKESLVTLYDSDSRNDESELDITSNNINEVAQIYSNNVSFFEINNEEPIDSIIISYPNEIILKCINGSISNIILNYLPNLSRLYVQNVKNIKTINLTSNTALQGIFIDESDIEEIILPSNISKIKFLILNSKNLTDLKYNKSLKFESLKDVNVVGNPYFTVDKLDELINNWTEQSPFYIRSSITVDKETYLNMTDTLKKKFTDKYIDIEWI